MKKATTKKKKQNPRNGQKNRVLLGLIASGIILMLSIVILLLLPDTEKLSQNTTREQPGPDQTPRPGHEQETRGTGNTENNSDQKTPGPDEITGELTPEPGEKTEKQQGKIAVVLDDAGHNINHLLPFLQFPHPLTIAVLPQRTYSREAATLALEAGKEVIMHLPMEPEGSADPGPGALYETQTKEEILSILDGNFSDVPGARGANNHMGSKITANPEIMETIFTYFAEKGLFFLDSRTTSKSICRVSATLAGIPFLERNIFLDNEIDKEIIREQMLKGIALAQENGYVILIGHVQNSEVLDILYEVLPDVIQNNDIFVGLSEILPKEMK